MFMQLWLQEVNGYLWCCHGSPTSFRYTLELVREAQVPVNASILIVPQKYL